MRVLNFSLFTLHSTFLAVFGQVDVIVLIGHIVQTSVFASIYDAWELVEHGDVVGRHNDSSSLLGDVFQQTDVSGSRLPVCSSAMMSFGLLSNARAMAMRCCSPPESS